MFHPEIISQISDFRAVFSSSRALDILDFTVPTDVFNTSAISSYERSSISLNTIVILSFFGSPANARFIAIEVSFDWYCFSGVDSLGREFIFDPEWSRSRKKDLLL